MKNLFLLFFLIAVFDSCKKENSEIIYVSHDSEIFMGNDSLIYGEWEYLYTEYGNFWGGYKQVEDSIFSLKIEPFDNYVVFKNETTFGSGKIDTLGHLRNYNYAQVIFYPDGIKEPNRISEIIYVIHNDTLAHGLFANDGSILYYYKRIR